MGVVSVLFLFVKAVVAVNMLLLAWVVCRVAGMAIKYHLRRRHIASQNIKALPGYLPIADFFDMNGKLEPALGLDRWQNEKGEMHRVVFAGAYLDGTPVLCFTHPGEIKELLQVEKYPKLPIAYDIIVTMLGDGLVTSTGSVWQRQRKLISPSFHFGQLKRMSSTMSSVTQNYLDRLGTEEVTVCEYFSDLTMRVIVDTSFSGAFDADEASRLFTAFNQAILPYFFMEQLFGRTLNKALPLPTTLRVNDLHAQLRLRVKNAIASKRRQLAEEEEAEDDCVPDLLTALLKARDEDGSSMDEELIISECLTFLFAGHDTTSSLMSWACVHLSKLPDIQQKLIEEVDRVVATDVPGHAHYSNLSYTRNVLKEVLRLSGPVPMLERLIPNDCELGGVSVKGGTYAWVMLGMPSQDERFFPNPQVFAPERWDDKEQAAVRHPFAFSPFSAGTRNCIGQKFALLEATIILASIMQRFTIAPPKHYELVPAFEGTMKPLKFRCSFQPRK